MRIVFRADSSLSLGNGHLMRCLTLANSLRQRGASCAFASRLLPGHLQGVASQCGHLEWTLTADEPETKWMWPHDAAQTQQAMAQFEADWLVVDHYGLDHQWQKAMRAHVRKMMVIDDLADRVHDCDLLLNQNLGRQHTDYQKLLPATAVSLTGASYALLRPDFAEHRASSLAWRAQTRPTHLLVSMGGVDQDNASAQVLQALKTAQLHSDIRITVVLGPHAPWASQVRALAADMPWPTQVLMGVSHMAELMAQSDLAIGAAGGSAWERCSLGLPSLVFVLADNQQAGAQALEDAGAALTVTDMGQLPGLAQQLLSADGFAKLAEMGRAAAAVTDGRGCERVLAAMEAQHG
jgi:UDP-2,4-diacetamido-2,4,6-trideoxy-beta-L-altropyranose hydrolase